jgi:hypothetical protein
LLGGREIHINSAFRSAEVNKAVGSSDKSQHRHGCAADIRVLRSYFSTPKEFVSSFLYFKWQRPMDMLLFHLELSLDQSNPYAMTQ